ncbi:MAG: C40 family peptidase [Verrucomicrobia bacterium]|nr:C40 family peptidase [Verrucomicrobiota bacterium]
MLKYVGVKRTGLKRGILETELLFGEPIRILAHHGKQLFVEAPDQPHFAGNWSGYRGWIEECPLLSQRPCPKPPIPLEETLRNCLGAPYVWGGLSPSGIDCSGLIHLAYRNAGRVVPRNAHDQWLCSTSKTVKELSPGHLFFKATGKRITHVLFYLGEGSYIESTTDVHKVRITTLEQKYGKSLEELLKNGNFLGAL